MHKPMAKSLFSVSEKKKIHELISKNKLKLNQLKTGHEVYGVYKEIYFGEFNGKQFVVKKKSHAHPNLKAHVSAVKNIYSELRLIMKGKKSDSLKYSVRFFDLGGVYSDFAIYENIPHSMHVSNEILNKNKQLKDSFNQFKQDLELAFNKFKEKNNGIIKIDGKQYLISPDFENELNFYFEGFDSKNRAKFILKDVVFEDLLK